MKVIKFVLLITIVLLFNLSCTSDSTIDDNNNDLNGTEFVNFELVDNESNSFLPFQMNDGELHIVVPPSSNIGNLIPKFEITGNFTKEEAVNLAAALNSKGGEKN